MQTILLLSILSIYVSVYRSIYTEAFSRGEDEPRTVSAAWRGDDDRGAEGVDQSVVCLAAVHDRLLAIQKARRSQWSEGEEGDGRDDERKEVEGREAGGEDEDLSGTESMDSVVAYAIHGEDEGGEAGGEDGSLSESGSMDSVVEYSQASWSLESTPANHAWTSESESEHPVHVSRGLGAYVSRRDEGM